MNYCILEMTKIRFNFRSSLRQNNAADRVKKISRALLTIPAARRSEALHKRIRNKPTR